MRRQKNYILCKESPDFQGRQSEVTQRGWGYHWVDAAQILACLSLPGPSQSLIQMMKDFYKAPGRPQRRAGAQSLIKGSQEEAKAATLESPTIFPQVHWPKSIY